MGRRAFAIVAGTGVLAGLVAVLLLLPAAGRPAAGLADEIAVRSLTRDGRVFVSFTLNSTLTDELRGAIRSGLPASIAYDVFLRRGTVLWFDRTIAHATVRTPLRGGWPVACGSGAKSQSNAAEARYSGTFQRPYGPARPNLPVRNGSCSNRVMSLRLGLSRPEAPKWPAPLKSALISTG